MLSTQTTDIDDTHRDAAAAAATTINATIIYNGIRAFSSLLVLTSVCKKRRQLILRGRFAIHENSIHR